MRRRDRITPGANAIPEDVAPEEMDAHIHLDEPGRSGREGFETGARDFAAGATTVKPVHRTRVPGEDRPDDASRKDGLPGWRVRRAAFG